MLQSETGFEEFSEAVLKAASYAHCELLRIHPFVNGNGRLARTVVNYFAVRYGFLRIQYDRPAGEYNEAIRAWLYHRNINGFMDFLRPTWQRLPAR